MQHIFSYISFPYCDYYENCCFIDHDDHIDDDHNDDHIDDDHNDDDGEAEGEGDDDDDDDDDGDDGDDDDDDDDDDGDDGDDDGDGDGDDMSNFVEIEWKQFKLLLRHVIVKNVNQERH